MNNNVNQDNYLLNQNTQQQYLNIQSYETQERQTQKIIDFSYSNEFYNSERRIDFIKKMYIFLAFEFMINFSLLALGTYTEMFSWFYHLHYKCKTKNNIEICQYKLEASWLFYVSLIISIVLQFILYFEIIQLRKDPLPKVLLILQLIFFGFTFTTVCVFVMLSVGPLYVMVSIGITFLLIVAQTIYLNLEISNKSYQTCSLLIIAITIMLVIILSFLRSFNIFSSIACSAFSLFYVFYLMIETDLLMCKATLQLQNSEYLYGSLVLNGLMIQSLVRICDIAFNALRKCLN